jgi:hypothetical protein
MPELSQNAPLGLAKRGSSRGLSPFELEARHTTPMALFPNSLAARVLNRSYKSLIILIFNYL